MKSTAIEESHEHKTVLGIPVCSSEDRGLNKATVAKIYRDNDYVSQGDLILPVIYGLNTVDHPQVENVEQTELEQYLNGYSVTAKSEGKSIHTIKITSSSVRYLERFLISENLSTNIADIGLEELRRYALSLQYQPCFAYHPQNHLQAKVLSGHSINGYMRGLKTFWSWLRREDYISENPFDKIRIPKSPAKIIKTFTDEQLKALLDAVDDKKPQGQRDRTILLLLLDTGVRSAELRALKSDDVHFDNQSLHIVGKGRKERIVPVGKRLIAALWKYLNTCRVQPALPQIDNVFLTYNGYPLTKERLAAIVKKYAEKAQITGVRASPHTFRHTMAVNYIRNGGDIFSLQRILGHAQLNTVRTYVNIAQSDIEKAHRRYSPVDNLALNYKA
jgi:site-specific recombinase XerD